MRKVQIDAFIYIKKDTCANTEMVVDLYCYEAF